MRVEERIGRTTPEGREEFARWVLETTGGKGEAVLAHIEGYCCEFGRLAANDVLTRCRRLYEERRRGQRQEAA